MQLKHYEIVTDEDKLNVDIQKVCMEHTTIKHWAYILHDKDDTRPHYHIYVNFGKCGVRSDLVANWFGVAENFVNKIKGKKSDVLLYLMSVPLFVLLSALWGKAKRQWKSIWGCPPKRCLHSYYTGVYNRFSYIPCDIALEAGVQDGKMAMKKYYLATKKIYSKRFSTDCFSEFFTEKTLKSWLGLDDLAEFKTEKASFSEMLQENSYFFEDLCKMLKSDKDKQG